MKNTLFLFLIVTSFSFANNSNKSYDYLNDPKIGDVLILNTPTNNAYKHVYFPKLNFIVKRGGLASYKSVYGKHVVIKDIISKDNGNTVVIVKPKDESKFFGFLKSVKVDYNKSLNSGEISKIK